MSHDWNVILKNSGVFADDAAIATAASHIEQAMGNPEKCATASELPNRSVARKSIVAARHIAKGEPLTDDNLTAKRPGTGISPMEWEAVVGTLAICDFNPDELIEIQQ